MNEKHRSETSDDPIGKILLLIGTFFSFLSFGVVFLQHLETAYPDSQAHLLIARRVCDSSSVGLAQLGAVWLPLTHVMSLPFICADVVLQNPVMLIGYYLLSFSLLVYGLWKARTMKLWSAKMVVIISLTILTILAVMPLVSLINSKVFYTTGFAQTVISMAAYVLLGFFTYKFIKELTGDHGAGLVAWLIVMVNPNILYLQATAMTELPLYCGIMVSIYAFWRLSKEPSSLKWLFWSGLAAFAMTLIRYEGWVILAVEVVLYAYILFRKQLPIEEVIGHLAMWSIGCAGVLGWLMWNMTIFQNPFEFQTGVYAKPSNWVQGSEAAIGNFSKAFMTYIFGMWDTMGPIILIGLVALLIYVLVTRLGKESFAPLLPMVLLPFFVYMLYKGQRPMQAFEIEKSIYNARFALVILLSVAPLIGWLTQKRLWAKLLIVTALFASNGYLLVTQGIITLREPLLAQNSNFSSEQFQAASWLAGHYDGEKMLIESYGNEQMQFVSGIDLKNLIYEGSYQQWQPTLADPFANHVKWVVMRGNSDSTVQSLIPSLNPDKVWMTLHTDANFQRHYLLVFKNKLYEIYRQRPSSAN